MRMEFLGRAGTDATGAEPAREIGAAVVRAIPGGEIALEFGPADGPAYARLTANQEEAKRLIASIAAVANGTREEILLTDD